MNWKTNFYELELGAAPEALERLRAAVPVTLPDSFYNLLAFSDGGEWPAGKGQFSFRLSSAEEIAENCVWEPVRPSAVHEFLRGFILIGTNGSGLCIGFDIRGKGSWPIVEVDAEAEVHDRALEIARDFDEFLDVLGV